MQTRSINILKQLVAFPSVSLTPNMDLINYVAALLKEAGIDALIVKDDSGTRANLFASTGPANVPGIVLSGHTDVVPVEGQAWTHPPFAVTEQDGLLYGRGTADMKGFVACAINAMLDASQKTLSRPLQLALSFDEEIGCVGVRRLLSVLEQSKLSPAMCIVGEPTMMQIATGHKGKAAYHAVCCGKEGHSALAPQFQNAIHGASDLITGMRQAQATIANNGMQDHDYDVPYSTIHVGKINGGKALNIVPNQCTVDFEIRTVAGEDADTLLASVIDNTERISREITGQASITLPEITKVNAYPGLLTHPTSEAVRFLENLLPPDTSKLKVAFGTEGGLFQAQLATPVLVCGPGTIDVAHKPDEHVAISQLDACDAFLARLISNMRQ
jgi:acetylornithine deacetylase